MSSSLVRPRVVPRVDRPRPSRPPADESPTLPAAAAEAANSTAAASSHEALAHPAYTHWTQTSTLASAPVERAPPGSSPGGSSPAPAGASGPCCPHCSSVGTLEYESTIGLSLCSECGRISSGGGVGSEGTHDDGTLYRDDDRTDQDGVGSTYVSHLSANGLSWSARTQHRSFVHATLARITPESSFWHDESLKRIKHKAHQLLHALHLPHSLGQQALRLMHVATNGTHGSGRWVEILLGASIYALCRMSHRPLTLVDVSTAVQTSVHRLGRMLRAVCVANDLHLPEADPAGMIERILARVAPSADVDGADTEHTLRVHSLRSRCQSLLHLARSQWLSAGRSPGAVCGAAVVLVLEGSGFDVRIDQVAAVAHCGVATVNNRVREMWTALLELARTQLPAIFVGVRVGAKQKEKAQIGFILEQLDVLVQMRDDEETTATANSTGPSIDGGSTTLSCVTSPTSFPAMDLASESLGGAFAPPAPSLAFARASVSSDPPSFKRSLVHRRGRLLRLRGLARDMVECGVAVQPADWLAQLDAELARTAPPQEGAVEKAAKKADLSETHFLSCLLQRGVPVDVLMRVEGPLYGLTAAALCAPTSQPPATGGAETAADQSIDERDLARWEERLYVRSDAEVERRANQKMKTGLKRESRKRQRGGPTRKEECDQLQRHCDDETTAACPLKPFR